MGKVVRRHSLQHGGRALLGAQANGNFDQLRRGHQGVFRIAARDGNGCYGVAGSESAHTRSQFLDRPRSLAAWNQRQRRFVGAFAEINLDEIDADGLDADQDLSRPRHRNRQLGQFKYLRPACGANLDSFHDRARMH